ncbi:MAG: hypothetical protein N2170_08550 [Bacteroidia bacterium]|nr:hypothetical protein [Bacteroidia bacterium]
MFLSVCSPKENSFEGNIQYSPRLEGEGSDKLEPFLKTQVPSFRLYHKAEKARIERSGDILLIDYKKDSFYVLFPESLSYRAYPLQRDTGKGEKTPIVTDLGDTRVVLGHTCVGKRVSYTTPSGEVYMKFWEAQDLPVPASAQKAFPILPRGVHVQGMPLVLESPVMDLPIRLVYEATEIKSAKLNDTLFSIPSLYKKVN